MLHIPRYQLFLGMPISNEMLSALEKISPPMRTFFIQNSPIYLREIRHNQTLYLGKEVGPIAETLELEALEANIYSLLQKLLPSHPFKDTSLVLFARESV